MQQDRQWGNFKPGRALKRKMDYIRLMFLNLFLQSALIIYISMTVLFLVAILIKDNSIVDSFWGFGFLVITTYTLIASGDITLKKILLLGMVALWSLRLVSHIFKRNRKRGEDFRYQAWRKQWKNFYLRSYFQVILLQGSIMVLVASPIIMVNSSSGGQPGFIYFLGITIFLAGFSFESIADIQLQNFKKDPENTGKLLTSGLWKFSRHPNYFGEAILWFGIWLIALPEVDGVFTILSPLLITFLLRYVSGVPMMEKKYEGSEEWESYKREAPPFVPKFRK